MADREQQEAVIRSFLASMEGDLDFEKAVEYFADDGIYYPNAWRRVEVGHDAILAELRRGAGGNYSELTIEVLTCTVADDRVVTERIDRFLVKDRRVDLHVVGVFDLDSNVKIARWSDYFDMKEIERQLR